MTTIKQDKRAKPAALDDAALDDASGGAHIDL